MAHWDQQRAQPDIFISNLHFHRPREDFAAYLHGSSINFNPVVLLSGRGSIGGSGKLNRGDATGLTVGAISNDTTFDRADDFGEVLL